MTLKSMTGHIVVSVLQEGCNGAVAIIEQSYVRGNVSVNKAILLLVI